MLPSSSIPAGARYYGALENYRVAVERIAHAEHVLEQAKAGLIRAHGDLAEAVEGLMAWGKKDGGK